MLLSCADSRVPPEILFDQGRDDLFVVRVAGAIATNDGVGSLEYGDRDHCLNRSSRAAVAMARTPGCFTRRSAEIA